MRILFAGHSLAAPLGGGELSARALLVGLGATHHVGARCVGRQDRSYDIGNGVACRDIEVHAPLPGMPMHLGLLQTESRFRPALAKALVEGVPDVLLLQQPACPNPVDLPRDTRVIVFIRSLACYGVGDPTPSRWKRALGSLFREVRWRYTRALLARADLIITNSRFLQRAVEDGAGVRSEVVPPFMHTAPAGVPTVPSDRPYLTFAGLDAWKGAAMALRLAEALPERHFLFLEGSRPTADLVARARRLPNVTCEPWTADMRPIFEKTRILLTPSLWEEPFGRLPVEAGGYGIPTVSSAVGGLPEAVGAGGLLIERADALPAWMDAIRSLDDPTRYATLSAAAQAHAAALDLRLTLARFTDLVRRHVGLDLGMPR